MGGKRHAPEIKQQALMLAAGQSSNSAAQSLPVPARTIRQWMSDADPSDIARYCQHKSRIGAQIGAQHIQTVVERAWEALETMPVTNAKELQAWMVSYGIADTRMRIAAGLDQEPRRVNVIHQHVRTLSDEELTALERRLEQDAANA